MKKLIQDQISEKKKLSLTGAGTHESIKVHLFWEDHKISTLLLSYVVPVKSMVEILQYFVTFSEYMNFILEHGIFPKCTSLITKEI